MLQPASSLIRWLHQRLALVGVLVLAGLPGSLQGADAPTTTLPTLTNISQVVRLGYSGALTSPHPVRVTGVITYATSESRERRTIHDGTGGCAIEVPRGVAVSIGDRVEVEGELGVRGYYACITKSRIRPLGKAELPTPEPATTAELVRGAKHAGWVRLEVCVLDLCLVGHRLLYLVQAGNRSFVIASHELVEEIPAGHLNATFEVTGVPWATADDGANANRFTLLVASNSWIRVLRPGTTNGFELPRSSIAAIHQAGPRVDRVVVSGVVTHGSPGNFFFLNDGTGNAVVHNLNPMPVTSRDNVHLPHFPKVPLQPGDLVEVMGNYQVSREFSPDITCGEYRVIGHQELPPSELVSEEEMLSGRPDCRRVRFRGRIVDRDTYANGNYTVQRLWVKSGERTFSATCFLGGDAGFRSLVGDRVELDGVAVVGTGNAQAVRTIGMYLQAPSDVRTLPEPPAWLSYAVIRTAGASAGVLAFAVGWIWLLRRQVRGRTTELSTLNESLSNEVQRRENVEATLRDRLRLDSLGAQVAVALNATISLQPMLQRCASLVASHLDAAFARIWTLNTETGMLELQASAGQYTHLDGQHSRIPIGRFKIGLIAADRKPHLTNDVLADDRVSDKEWARSEGVVSFAGYPLLLDGTVLGVIALFARRPLQPETLQALGVVADSIALGIERKRAETALAESEARTRLIVDNALDAVVTMDSEGLIRGWNAQATVTFGWTPDEALGRSMAQTLLPPAHRDALLQGLREFLESGSADFFNRRLEIQALHQSGREFPVEIAVAPLRVGSHWIFSAVARDITERKHAESELLKTLGRERELNELKTNFVSMVSHEFRTPLGVIMSATEVLQRYFDRLPAERRGRHLDMILRSSRNLAQLMEEVLLLGRVEDGRMRFMPAPLDLEGVCRTVADEVLSATNAACPVLFRPGPNLAGAVSDESLIRHIVANLLSNAVKYSEPGSSVEFHAERHDTEVHLVIRDRGIGILPEDQPMIFNSFTRGRNVGQRPGSGLGLLIVKRCVDLHGGALHLDSAPGRGTEVTVKLPVYRPPTRAADALPILSIS